jgi:DNA polymerase I-like protein with 3'-5' exonuclease and polymerase domains
MLTRKPPDILQKARDYLAAKNGKVTTSKVLDTLSKTPDKGETLLEADQRLSQNYPNLIFDDTQVGRVLGWLRSLKGLAVDIETHGGDAKRKEQRRKRALSFVRSKVRLVQLFSQGDTYILDAELLSRTSVASVLEALRGKELYLHNATFDVPRLLRHFGVDLIDEDIRDTMVLSRLCRSGQWEYVAGKTGGYATVNLRHQLRDVLIRELGVEIPKESEHKWHAPLTEEDLRYAEDDIAYLGSLYHKLAHKVGDDGLRGAQELISKIQPLYMRQQARGVPFDKDLYLELRQKVMEKLELLDTQLREHAPEHPEEGSWVWRNNRKPEEKEGRKGALRALALAGTPLPNLRKSTRLSYLKKLGDKAPLLQALDEYLKFADLESDTRGWLELYYEDGRLFPNVQFFSQVTGRSAYSGPALQNIAKSLDVPGLEEASFRDCVRARRDDRAIIKADYSAQELRILAYETGDENLLQAFLDQAKGGKDPHLVVGEKIAGTELEKGTEEYDIFRAAGKRANYGFSYGAGWSRYQKSIYEDTGEVIGDKQAKAEKEAFREAWPKVAAWQKRFGDRGGQEPEDWYTTSFLDRRRYVSRGTDGRPGYCDRLNGPIQGGGADQLYLALERLLDDPIPECHVAITTHDEIVCEAPTAQAEKVATWLASHMRAAVAETVGEELATEDCVEVEIATSWKG